MRARPGLVRTDARHQLRAADGAPDEISGDVGQPDDREQKQDRGEAEARVAAQQDRRDQDGRRIDMPAAHHRRRTRDASAATPRQPSAMSAAAILARSNASASAEPASATAPVASTALRSCAQTSVSHSHSTIERGDRPEHDERHGRRNRPPRSPAAPAPATTRSRSTRLLRPAETDAGWILATGGAPLTAHEPVCAISPPNRRSRRRYSAIALFERGAVEIRPVGRHEHKLAVGRLPQQEIRQPLLAAGADDQVGIGQIRRVEIAVRSVRR